MISRELSGKNWRISFEDGAIEVASASKSVTIDRSHAKKLSVQRRRFRFHFIRDDESLATLVGCRKPVAAEIAKLIGFWELLPPLLDAVAWKREVEAFLTDRGQIGRWTSFEDFVQLETRSPAKGLLDRCRRYGCEDLLNDEQRLAAIFVETNLAARVEDFNRHFSESELISRRAFFDSIERTPLSDEQANAVICFENRVQVLAAAGSGKTSVMVAKAAYAVDRNLVKPERVLLLAFNRAAAKELQERIASRFAAAGIPSEGVTSSTFHAFGLEVIGLATGKKPRLSQRLEQGDDLALTMEIVDQLRDDSDEFRYSWDLYRLLFANASTRLDDYSPDGYDKVTATTGYRTFSGILVKSEGERLIADYLYLNGVQFEYERSFVFDVADATHSQYHPDFYYPEIGVWHEHWAINQDGKPPADFAGYSQDMRWKQNIHAQFGTTLIETTWADVMFDDGLQRLQDKLTELGVNFEWNPDRPSADSWTKPLKHEDLARLVRTFMTHVKSNAWSFEDIVRRLESEMSDLDGFRTRLFLTCYKPIHEEWERRLAEDNSVDFEDMLVKAAELLEEDSVDLPYELILVDEFQDSSQARARLVKGLLNAPGRCLLAVGDDWQSINRFAGADLSVMKQFSTWFGRSRQLALTNTYRCSQEICDVARNFVSRNPIQFEKSMRSMAIPPGRPVTVVLTDDESGAIVKILRRISSEALSGSTNIDTSASLNVKVLGRYGFQRDLLPTGSWKGLNVTFMTVHGSKGLEADFVIVPGMSTGTYGFPSTVHDDPVLALAMPAPELFPHAEERRLFYVALTRARRGVFVLAPPSQPSPFVVEILTDRNVIVESPDRRPVIVCSSCKKGTMVERHGPFDPFLGCTRFPICQHKEKIVCPGCFLGILVRRNGPYGPFIGCSSYPSCRYKAKFKINQY